MTEPPAISPADAAVPVSAAPESFWGTVLRRLRYAIAILLSALLFGTLGWWVASPPPQVASVSLTVWPGHSALLAVIVLAAILLAATAVGSLLCHPDSPHQGLWCALLGMVALSSRGGTSFTLVQYAQDGGADHYAGVCRLLALECIHWTVLFLLAETFARFVHDRFLANTRWITRISPGAATRMVGDRAATLPRAPGKLNLPAAVAGPLALLMNAALGALCLAILLQSEAKGQVVAACFFGFLASTFITAITFPNVSAMMLFLSVPLAAAAGYLYASGQPGLISPSGYPGHPGNFFPRALPIDFFAAGMPGAISGYYFAFHVTLNGGDSEKA
jgi:hypothetical protein